MQIATAMGLDCIHTTPAPNTKKRRMITNCLEKYLMCYLKARVDNEEMTDKYTGIELPTSFLWTNFGEQIMFICRFSDGALGLNTVNNAKQQDIPNIDRTCLGLACLVFYLFHTEKFTDASEILKNAMHMTVETKKCKLCPPSSTITTTTTRDNFGKGNDTHKVTCKQCIVEMHSIKFRIPGALRYLKDKLICEMNTLQGIVDLRQHVDGVTDTYTQSFDEREHASSISTQISTCLGVVTTLLSQGYI
jgi:hypothetical protein